MRSVLIGALGVAAVSAAQNKPAAQLNDEQIE